MTEKLFRVHDIVRFDYSEIGQYIDENHTDKPLRNDEIVDLLNELSEENEQLKQRNTNQYNQLNQLWQLIEAKDWKTLTEMDNQIKEDEERLQQEWKCYND